MIFEAVCNVDSLQDEIKDSFFDLPLRLAVLASLYLVFCSIPLGVYYGKRVSDSWRLFLTKSRIYYKRKHHCCLCRSANTDIYVALTDVNAVYVDTIPMQRGCYSNPEVMATDLVIVELKRECREEFFHQSTDRASGKHGKRERERERERERKFGKGRQTHICIILYHQSCCSLVNVSYLFMQHTNLVISKYVQPDLNLPEHQTE